MLSALMLCWRNDNTVLQPAEMISQHPICISKPRLNSSAICVRVRSCASVRSPERHTHAGAFEMRVASAFLRGKLFLASQFIPDKLSYCFSEIIKKKHNYLPINIPATWSSSSVLYSFCGNACFDTICHLVSLFWRSCHSKAGFTLSGHSTPQHLMWQSQQTLIHLALAQPTSVLFLLRTRCWKQRLRGCFMTGNEPFISSQSLQYE